MTRILAIVAAVVAILLGAGVAIFAPADSAPYLGVACAASGSAVLLLLAG